MQRALVLVLMLTIACSPSEPGNHASDQQSRTTDRAPIQSLPPVLRVGALRGATASEISAAIAHYGAEAVVNSLYGEQSDQGWSHVLNGVASGEPAWLSLVPALREGAIRSAGPSEDLDIVVSDALPRNAPGVLRLATTRDSVEQLCSFRRIEPTEAETAAFYTAAERAVLAVNDPALEAVKRQCLASLGSSH